MFYPFFSVPKASNIMLNHSFMMSKISPSKQVASELYCFYNSTVFFFYLTDRSDSKEIKRHNSMLFPTHCVSHIQVTEVWVDMGCWIVMQM